MTDDITGWFRIDDIAERAAIYQRAQWTPRRRYHRYDGI
jgi:hypothetical protein